MVISNISYKKDLKTVTLSADITFSGKKTERAYITVDKKYERFIARDVSPFLAAVLLPCMKSKENIFVEGSVSEKFLKNANEIMKLVVKWKIGLSRIKIRTTATTKDSFTPKYTASFFTAGVDSFYTYLKNKHKTTTKISHLILVHGFDIPLSNKDFFKQVKTTVEKVAKEEKVHAVFLETNLGEIVEKRLIWDFAHGGALAAIALMLRKNLKTVLIPGAVRNDQLFPYGTHPDLDVLWSTEKMKVKSDGGEYDRIGKVTKLVSKSPLALKYLRVCTQNIKGKYNCSRCYKCLMTMIYLEISHALKNAKTFDKNIDLEGIRRMYYDYKLKYNIQGEQALLLLKKKKQNPALQKAIAFSLEKSKKPGLIKHLTQTVAAFDQKYNDRRLYQFVFSMNNGDRNVVFKYLFKRGLLK
jgi:hypothetical protein